MAACGTAPALADTGNGDHVIVRAPLATGTEVAVHTWHCKELLEALHVRFSMPEAKVDRGIFNPGRILQW